MKYGIREICDVVLKAKAKMTVGNKVFYKDEPVIYFDSLKTSTMEGAATTVYAQGGRGNARLIAWEGERTVTFTMEDALISTLGLAILTGANVIDATTDNKIKVHTTEQIQLHTDTAKKTEVGYFDTSAQSILLSNAAYAPATTANDNNHYVYVMVLDDNGNVNSEPLIYKAGTTLNTIVPEDSNVAGGTYAILDTNKLTGTEVILVDYYVEKAAGQQIEITADKFGGNFYLEASTLFRDTNGTDLPAEFIIPNCKVQSNFTFTMASSGDPSTFTFTMDAFPDYTRFDRTKKVLSVIQVLGSGDDEGFVRVASDADASHKAGDDTWAKAKGTANS